MPKSGGTNIIKDFKLVQRRLVTLERQTANDISKTFAKLMLWLKVNVALKLVTTECDNGVHEINDETMKLQAS